MITASVIIRAFNEEKHIGTLLERVFKQRVDFNFEVVLVDSGSTDRTLEIASAYDVKLVQILPSEFTFGFSLNTGIAAASGKVCLIISAHCYPCDESWLANMVSPFIEDEDIAIAYGRQTGTNNTFYSEQQIFNQWFPLEEIDDSNLAFCNNANSAIRRSIWEGYKFDETLTGLEDLDWAKHVKRESKKIKYIPSSAVFHIHEEDSKQTFNRYYREGLAYRQIYPNEYFSFLDFLRFFLTNVISDMQHSIVDGVFFKVFGSILRFRFLQFWATYRAHQYKVSIHGPMKRRLYYPIKKKKRPVVSDPISFETSKFYDITRALASNTPVWPGVNGFEMNTHKSIEEDGVKDSSIRMNLHCGTHVDSPSHFVEGMESIDQVKLDTLIGEAFVLNYEGESEISTAFFKQAKIPVGTTRILLKTKNSLHREDSFPEDYVAITSESAQWLVENGISLIGIDGPSIQLYSDQDNSTHEILLKEKVVIVEGLDLDKITPGFTYDLTVLPLRIFNGEAAPARAILQRRGTI